MGQLPRQKAINSLSFSGIEPLVDDFSERDTTLVIRSLCAEKYPRPVINGSFAERDPIPVIHGSFAERDPTLVIRGSFADSTCVTHMGWLPIVGSLK